MRNIHQHLRHAARKSRWGKRQRNGEMEKGAGRGGEKTWHWMSVDLC